jgi:hypothetical protein
MNDDFKKLAQALQQKKIHFYIVTADKQNAEKMIGSLPADLLLCDGTVIKTAARVNATYFVMQGAEIIDKFSYIDLNKHLDEF